MNFEGREAKGLSKARYDETFAGEDDHKWTFPTRRTIVILIMCSRDKFPAKSSKLTQEYIDL